MRKLLLASILSVPLLSGCIFNPVKVTTEPVERIPLVVPSADAYNHRTVEWIVITPENAAAVFAEMKRKGEGVVIFALTSKGYENLSLNTADQLKIMRQDRAIIEAYQKYYVDQNKAIDKTNDDIAKLKSKK